MGIKSFGNNAEDFVSKFLRARSFDSTGLDAANPEPPPLIGLTATGGVISDYTSPPGVVYRAHIFTSSGTFEVEELGYYGDTVEYLVVGGGGAGGGGGASEGMGGGGAGGYLTGSSPVSVTSYTITIGAGGNGADAPSGAPTPGVDTTFGPIARAAGGGRGTGYYGAYNAADVGGSGGGGGYSPTPTGASGNQYPPNSPLFPAPAPGQGNPGGNYGPTYAGAGGGGAGAAGQNGGPTGAGANTAGKGGDGLRTTLAGPNYPVGTPGPGPTTGGWLAGGGGGGNYFPSGPTGPFPGGAGGGGAGVAGNADAESGVQSTGGGGGSTGNQRASGNGGSGIAIIRYQIAQLAAAAKASGGSISYYDGKTIHTFTSSGTFQTTTAIPTAEVFIVAGGGSGGPGANPTNYASGGGGGAGGVVYHPGLAFPSPATYTITVGGGGAAPIGTSPTNRGTDGADTTVTHPSGPYVAYRGGAGGAGWPGVGSNTGGSSGGGC